MPGPIAPASNRFASTSVDDVPMLVPASSIGARSLSVNT